MGNYVNNNYVPFSAGRRSPSYKFDLSDPRQVISDNGHAMSNFYVNMDREFVHCDHAYSVGSTVEVTVHNHYQERLISGRADLVHDTWKI